MVELHLFRWVMLALLLSVLGVTFEFKPLNFTASGVLLVTSFYSVEGIIRQYKKYKLARNKYKDCQ